MLRGPNAWRRTDERTVTGDKLRGSESNEVQPQPPAGGLGSLQRLDCRVLPPPARLRFKGPRRRLEPSPHGLAPRAGREIRPLS